MYCPNCGKDSIPGSKFCDNCGTILPAEQASQPPSDQQHEGVPPPPYTGPYGQPPPYGQPSYMPLPMKDPGLTAVLAFLFTGLGHIYLGLVTKGILYMVLAIVLLVSGIFTFGITWIIWFVFWIWQIFDAYKLANRYNSSVKQTGQAPW